MRGIGFFFLWILGRQLEDNTFIKKIIFSEGAHFHLNELVNKPHYRMWEIIKFLLGLIDWYPTY